MTYQVVLKDDAKNDIFTLNVYLRTQFGESVRKKQVSILIAKLIALGSMPNQGASILQSGNVKIRLLHGPHNTILYEVNEPQNTVTVLRLYDNRSDFMHKLRNIFNF